MQGTGAIHLAMGLCAAGGLALAVLLLRRADTTAGARPLAVFVVLVGCWAMGLLIPNQLGAALQATAPVTGAVFVHFAVRLSGLPWPQRPLAALYALGATATLAALVFGEGSFIPWPGTGTLFRHEGAGLVADAITVALAALGNGLLLRAWFQTEGVRRYQLALVLASSALGLASVTGLAFPVFDIQVFPWPLLLMPAYLVALVYAVLRYQLMEVNRWARKAVSWGLLTSLAGAASALSAGVVAEQTGGAPFMWTAAAVLAGFALAAPVQQLADSIIYPGGEVKAADIANWRQAMSDATGEAELEAIAGRLLRERLKLPADTPLGDLEQAPLGARHVVEVMAEVMADARRDLERHRAFAERQRLAELGALAATVAHDLRNPMNIVSMAVAGAEPATRFEVKMQLQRMESLVRDLLDYAKPWRIEAAEISLADAITEADAMVASDIPPGLQLRADPIRLRQALVNLVENAKAAGGRVLVAAECVSGSVLVHVCDDGAGIPEDIRHSLFQPFVSRGQDGTGLGLAIVAKVMAAHGGTVALATRPGWTTCFTLSFPK